MANAKMPRPGQAAQRRRNELAQDNSDSDEYYLDDTPADGHPGGIAPLKRTRQVLPVAELEEGWEGEVEDGATFLALANRSNAQLPSFTRVTNPYRIASPPPVIDLLPVEGQDQAGPSRHPALPTEAWATLFAAHFENYRQDVASRWPPKQIPPYPADQPPIPTFADRHQWFWYINGFRRKKIRRGGDGEGAGDEGEGNERKAFSPSRPSADGTNGSHSSNNGANSTNGTIPKPAQEDEEDFMNNLPEPSAPIDAGPAITYDLEPELPRHRPREPTITILSHLNSTHIISILIQLSYHLSRHIDRLTDQLALDAEGDNSVMDLEGSHGPNLSASVESESDSAPNPYTAHLCSWVFAILLILNRHLHPDDIHVLRQFARDIMRVGGWRYIKAVQDGEVQTGWELGRAWRDTDGSDPASTQRADESSVDETLARCWMTVHAIAVGWGQHDLLEALDNLFK